MHAKAMQFDLCGLFMGREAAIREYVTLGYQDNKHRIMLFLQYSFRRIISNRGNILIV